MPLTSKDLTSFAPASKPYKKFHSNGQFAIVNPDGGIYCPTVFWRGYDLYDPVDVGFLTQGAEAERVGTRHDVHEHSNANGGHLFGTDLPVDQKTALLEYLKTL